MTKGKFGLSLVAVAVIAFAFAVIRQPTLVLLVCGFALLAEKDEWLNRQAIQALFLTIAYYLVDLVLDWIFGGLARFFGWVKLYGVVSAMSTVGSILNDILYLALIVFSVIAILRVVRGKDADLPFISKMAGGDFSAVTKSKVGTTVAPVQTVPPVQATPYQTQYAPPVQPADPIQTPQTPPSPTAATQTPPAMNQATPTPSVRLCPVCSALLDEDSRFCPECGAKTE